MKRGLLDTLAAAALHHVTGAMAPLKARLDGVCAPDFQVAQFIAAAPVTFHRRQFDVIGEDEADEGKTGEAAIVVAMPNQFGEIDDAAAFEAKAPFRTARLFADNPALGLRALFDARLHPEARVLMHANLWSWLAAGGEGLLPLDWAWMAIELKARRVTGIVAPNLDEGRTIERRLKAALKPPKVFIATPSPPEISEAA